MRWSLRFPGLFFSVFLAGCTADGVPASGSRGGHDTETVDAGSSREAGTRLPSADPSRKGPFATLEVDNVGDDGTFTLYRPADLTQGGPFPVITWGNGTGSNPQVYGFLLGHLASHGFIVIASNSMNVAQGSPPPMLVGVDWVFSQNGDGESDLFGHVDTAHVGATGHSQGGFATMSAAGDEHIVAVAPIEGASPNAKLHGPALVLCGGADTVVGCTGSQAVFDSTSGVPVLYAEALDADHTSWVAKGLVASFGGGGQVPFVVMVTAWMRLQLMDDQSLRGMFYGPDCTLCQDGAWRVEQKEL